jgi:hypothetical protein
MNRLTLALTGLLLAAGVHAAAHATDVRPGTPTPQPFEVPQSQSLPKPAPGSPRLLDHGRENAPGSVQNPRPLTQPKPDSDLPLLEQQRERNYQPLERRQGQP